MGGLPHGLAASAKVAHVLDGGNPSHVFLKNKQINKELKGGVNGLFNLGAKLSNKAIKIKNK